MDLSRPSINAVRAHLPQATLVLDQLPVVKPMIGKRLLSAVIARHRPPRTFW